MNLVELVQHPLATIAESLAEHPEIMAEAATGSPLTNPAGATGPGLILFVFALAIFLGVELIAKIPSQLHTPLMSGSNAISGITIVGALLIMRNVSGWLAILLGLLAVIAASVNVVGGYLVTDRMLAMFKAKKGGN